MTTFAQLSARLKNVLGGWLWVLGIKEGLVECATVCVKSVVILMYLYVLENANACIHMAWIILLDRQSIKTIYSRNMSYYYA